MEEYTVGGISTEVYNPHEIEASRLPTQIKDSINSHIEVLEEKTKSGELPVGWPGFMIEYSEEQSNHINIGDGSIMLLKPRRKSVNYLMVVNDTNKYYNETLGESVKIHEGTHVYLCSKCKNMNKSIEEGVAIARADLFLDMKDCGDVPTTSSEDVADCLKEYGKEANLVDRTLKIYYNAAKEIGDDVSLSLIRDSANESGDILETFQKKVSDYKDALKLTFG